MHTVLGLSLTSDDVAWVLLDPADGTILDHDVLKLAGDVEIAGTFARSAHSIGRACGFDVDHVRLTWTSEAAHDGLRLQTRLESLGFGEVEVVPMACVMTVPVDPEETGVTARLALAYGAARAVLDTDEDITVPVAQQIPQRSLRPLRRIASSVLGIAAAAALGVVFLSTGATPPLESPTTAAEEFAAPNAGWATVPAPSEVSAARKLIAAQSGAQGPSTARAQSPSTLPAQSYRSVRADVPAAAEQAAPQVAPTPAKLPHLSGVPHAMGAGPGPAETLTLPGPADTLTLPGPAETLTLPAPAEVLTTASDPDMAESSREHLPTT